MIPPAETPAPSAPDARPGGNPPTCVFISGPRGAGKTRWLQQRILELAAVNPGMRCGVVLAEDGHTRMEGFAHEVPGVAVRRVLMPCPCCPARANLPETLRQLWTKAGAGHLFIEIPAMAAAGLMAEFDRELGWPRQTVVCLNAKWEEVRHRREVPPFLTFLLAQASLIVPASSRYPVASATGESEAGHEAPTLILS